MTNVSNDKKELPNLRAFGIINISMHLASANIIQQPANEY